MKTTINLLALGAFLLSGCLMPKQVEFGQDRVKPFPVAKAAETEVQRQTAQRAARKADETFRAALETQASLVVVKPAAETAVLTEAVTTSLGPPLSPAPDTTTSVQLAQKLDTAVAKLETRIDGFKTGNNENVGKAVEGTGVFQIGYLTQFLVIGALLFLAWIAVKVVGLFNPAVAVGSRVLSGGIGGVSKLVGKGFSEVIEAGEEFKEQVEKKFEDPATKKKILELFHAAQVGKQSRDVQDVIRNLIN